MAKKNKVMTDKEYLDNGGGHCPVCKSSEIISNSMESDDSSIWSVSNCSKCGSEWKDIFTLSGYSDLENNLDKE